MEHANFDNTIEQANFDEIMNLAVSQAKMTKLDMIIRRMKGDSHFKYSDKGFYENTRYGKDMIRDSDIVISITPKGDYTFIKEFGYIVVDPINNKYEIRKYNIKERDYLRDEADRLIKERDQLKRERLEQTYEKSLEIMKKYTPAVNIDELVKKEFGYFYQSKNLEIREMKKEQLWWEIEKDEKKEKLEAVIALRNDIRKIVGL